MNVAAISAGDIATITTAVGGILVGVVTAFIKRGSGKNSNDNNTTTPPAAGPARPEAQSELDILQGYAQIVGDLRTEIQRIREQYQQDLEAWRKERTELLEELAKQIGQGQSKKDVTPPDALL